MPDAHAFGFALGRVLTELAIIAFIVVVIVGAIQVFAP